MVAKKKVMNKPIKSDRPDSILKSELLWRTCWGTHWELGKHIENLMGTLWELKRNIMGTHWEPEGNEFLSFNF
jgi:hypothetical protein